MRKSRKTLQSRYSPDFSSVKSVQNQEALICIMMYFLQSCTAEKSVACPADFLDIADILVDVGVHGHRNFGMSGNALQGFDVYATCGLQLGQEGVAKHMRGHTLGKVDFLADSLPCVSEGTFA